ncbi:UNVERIFIED_CONTAM: hypothetical protein HDU68_002591, partial [Siphonaria sp. JEL0065]
FISRFQGSSSTSHRHSSQVYSSGTNFHSNCKHAICICTTSCQHCQAKHEPVFWSYNCHFRC